MNTQAKLHSARLLQWSQHFSRQQASGLCARQWCIDNHISYHAFNYWKRQLKEAVIDKALPDIVPIALPDTAFQTPAAVSSDSTFLANCTNHSIPDTVRLSVNGLDLQLEADIPDMFLAKLIKAVRYA